MTMVYRAIPVSKGKICVQPAFRRTVLGNQGRMHTITNLLPQCSGITGYCAAHRAWDPRQQLKTGITKTYRFGHQMTQGTTGTNT